jgi:hypothetical protein
MSDIGHKIELGIQDLSRAPVERAPAPGAPAPTRQPSAFPPGRTGAIPESFRKGVRSFVEGLNPVTQFIVESAPATLGTAIGTFLGLPGAIAGGLGMEFLAQETGISPQSDANLGLSAGGPLIGKGLGAVLKVGRRGVGGALTGLPPAKAAMARNVMQKSVSEMESLASKIFSRQKGLMRIPSDKLFNSVKRLGGNINFRRLINTNITLGQLRKEAVKLKAFPEGKALLNVIDSVRTTLKEAGQNISFDTLVGIRRLLGAAVGRLEGVGGLKFGGGKALFSAMYDDLAIVGRGAVKGKPGQRGARLVQAAFSRAKLEFSLQDLEAAVARFTKPVPGKDISKLDIRGLQKWLIDVTNPKNSKYQKNFSEALKDEIPALKKTLMKLSEFAGSESPGGPGSIVTRGITAGIGGTVGFTIAGPVGAGAGTLVGASMPEMLVALLTTKPGAAFLTRAAQLGKGAISAKSWAIGGQIVAQMIGAGEPSSSGTLPSPFKPEGVGGQPSLAR